MKSVQTFTLFALLLSLASPAFGGKLFVAPNISTLGPGIDLGYEITEYVKVRGTVHYLSLSFDDREVDDVDYDVDVTLLSGGVFGDVHPFGGTFRVTGGILYNGNNLDLDGRLDPAETVDIGDQTFTGAALGSLNAEADFRAAAPYLGIGFGSGPESDRKWFFSMDLGVLFQGSPDIDLSAENEDMVPGLAAEIQREEDNIEDDLDGFRFYPVVSLGAIYRF